ncbi:Thiosulfate sulfurtransferase [Zostera marina]|uniref:Sulfurtransferase n=1 Tax=Zostera marina TaxID=29655 RepID=A0A0K9P393_ZOSMR|nr:Thiosulfate sulfurtransferase [Zostera marina]
MASSTMVVTGIRSIGAMSVINRTSARSLNSKDPFQQLSFFKRKLVYSYPNASSFLAPTSAGVFSSCTSSTATLAVAANDPVVSVDWLHANLNERNIKVLDASWYMPNEERNPFQEFQMAHIPNSIFFDVDGISDQSSNMPHMLPSEEGFSVAVSALGINNEDVMVVYDGKGIFSAARVWWMFRVFGHHGVFILDGGLPKWRTAGYDVKSIASRYDDEILKTNPATDAIEKHYQGLSQVGPITFKAKLQPHLLWTLDQIKKNIEEQTHQHMDARGKARFNGTAPEPRKGIKSGHVPGSKCIPFGEILDSQQTLLQESELAKRFEAEGISLDRDIVVSCGTGVTACILAVALYRLGKPDVPIYDGSWTEWASKSDTPIATV